MPSRITPGPQQWIEAKAGPSTLRLVMRRDTPMRSELVSEPQRSRDKLRVVGADGSSERRPIGGGGRGFAAIDEGEVRWPRRGEQSEVVLRLPPEVVGSEPAWITFTSSLFPNGDTSKLESLEPEVRRTIPAWPVDVEVEVHAENGWIGRGRYRPQPDGEVLVELAAVAPRRIVGRVVAHGKPLDQGEVRGAGRSERIGADGNFLMEVVPDSRDQLCVWIGGRRVCQMVPAGGDLEVELDVTPVRIGGKLVGTSWSDISSLELVSNPISSAASTQPGIFLGPEGVFETPELPAGCYVIWGAWPTGGGGGVGAMVRLEPGERAELVLDADHPSAGANIGHFLMAEKTCQPIEARVIQ